MTEITQVKLDEMLAGLEGVTRGPWEHIVGTGKIRSEGHDGNHEVARSDLMWGLNRSGVNADHIARCDPDTMRALLALASQALRSQGEAAPVGWIETRTIGLPWAQVILASNPEYVTNNGPENFTPLYAHPHRRIKPMSSAELKPCPFCGGAVELQTSKTLGDRLFVIACKSDSPCLGSGLGIYVTQSQKTEAIAAWNRRPQPSPSSADTARNEGQDQ